MNLKLFYVRADLDGENQDLLVLAEKGEDCPKMWREHYELDDRSEPMWVGEVPGVTAAVDRQPGPIDWAHIN